MGDGESDIEYRYPFGVTCDDEGDHVRVMVVIPNLKKAFGRNEASRGSQVHFKADDRSFDLKVAVMSKDSGAKKLQHYRYQIHKLPAPVLPSKCEYKIKDGKIIIKLVKAKNESWQAVLSDSGLETQEDAEDIKESS